MQNNRKNSFITLSKSDKLTNDARKAFKVVQPPNTISDQFNSPHGLFCAPIRSTENEFSELTVKYNPHALSQPITSSDDSVRVLRKIWNNDLMSMQEQMYVLFLNNANQVICYRCLNTGTSSQTLFDIKLALACALKCLASKLIIAHNHPSENLRPSKPDIMITGQLHEAAKLMDIKLIDHIILNRFDYYSFLDNGIIF